MIANENFFFYQTIHHLREQEAVLLYTYVPAYSNEEQEQLTQFLKEEYEQEATGYPYTPPAFDGQAALWAARIVYETSHLLLHRQKKKEALDISLQNYNGVASVAAILSADLCLRFLPYILQQAKLIDADDVIIEMINRLLTDWHYAAIGHLDNTDNLNTDIIHTDPCLQQLYYNRIIERKDNKLAAHPAIAPGVRSSMGDFTKQFWKELA